VRLESRAEISLPAVLEGKLSHDYKSVDGAILAFSDKIPAMLIVDLGSNAGEMD